MDSGDKALLTGILGCVAILVGGIGSCTCVVNHQDDIVMAQMVEHGADPLSAKCAVKGEGQSGACAIIAARAVH